MAVAVPLPLAVLLLLLLLAVAVTLRLGSLWTAVQVSNLVGCLIVQVLSPSML